MISVLLADDHRIVREGLHALLAAAPGVEVVGETGDGGEVVRLTVQLMPDVAVVDLSMPHRSGLEIVRELRHAAPRTRTLILSMHEREELVAAALAAGARGFVVKSGAASDLVRGIRAVAAGRRFLSAPFSDDDLARLDRLAASAGVDGLTSLTPRQMEVLRHIANGRTNSEVAAELGISVRTVESHRAALLTRLGVRSTAGLTRYAIAHGLVATSPDGKDRSTVP